MSVGRRASAALRDDGERGRGGIGGSGESGESGGGDGRGDGDDGGRGQSGDSNEGYGGFGREGYGAEETDLASESSLTLRIAAMKAKLQVVLSCSKAFTGTRHVVADPTIGMGGNRGGGVSGGGVGMGRKGSTGGRRGSFRSGEGEGSVFLFHFIFFIISSLRFPSSFVPFFLHSFVPLFLHSFIPSFFLNISPFLLTFLPFFVSSLTSIHPLLASSIHSFIPSFHVSIFSLHLVCFISIPPHRGVDRSLLGALCCGQPP